MLLRVRSSRFSGLPGTMSFFSSASAFLCSGTARPVSPSLDPPATLSVYSSWYYSLTCLDSVEMTDFASWTLGKYQLSVGTGLLASSEVWNIRDWGVEHISVKARGMAE